MKLNLLPTHVSKEKSVRVAWLLAIFVFAACVFGSIFLLSLAPAKDLEASKEGIADAARDAKKAKDTSDEADQVMLQATVLLRNTQLSQAMLDHNTVYPDTFDEVKRYVPSFFRVNSMSAAASGEGVSTVTLVGVLDTYQQYADVMLAFLRDPNVMSVSRSGFQNDAPYVPAPTVDDQWGKPHKPGEAPIPDDPLKRLAYFQAEGKVVGYTGTGSFGSGQDGLRGAMPNASQVTITLVMRKDLRVPDPRATLSAGGGSATGASGGGPGATGGSTPAAPGPVRGPANTTAPPPSTGRGKNNKKDAGSDDEG